MAKEKVSQLPAATAIGKTDLIHIVVAGVSKKATGAMILLQESAAEDLGLKAAAFKDVGNTVDKVSAGDHGHENGANIGGPYALAGFDGSPVGKIEFFARTTAPAQRLAANGALLSRAAYPALWAEAQASGNLVSEAAWAAGQYGSYSVGNGTTTFRIPYINGYTIRALDNGRGIDAGRALGSAQADDNKTHAHPGVTTFGMTEVIITPNSTTSKFVITSPVSGSTGAAGGTETRMKNIALLACIKYI